MNTIKNKVEYMDCQIKGTMVLWKQNGDEIFEVEIVLLHAYQAKRNVGRVTSTNNSLVKQ